MMGRWPRLRPWVGAGERFDSRHVLGTDPLPGYHTPQGPGSTGPSDPGDVHRPLLAPMDRIRELPRARGQPWVAPW